MALFVSFVNWRNWSPFPLDRHEISLPENIYATTFPGAYGTSAEIISGWGTGNAVEAPGIRNSAENL